MRLRFAIVLATGAVFGGTAISAEVRYEPNESVALQLRLPPKSNAQSVEVLEVRSPRSHVAIGRVAVRAPASVPDEELLTLARAKAAEAGADFLLVTRTDEGLRGRRGPLGAASGGALSRRGGSISSVRTLYATAGVYTKATLGLDYMSLDVTWGRLIVKGFREASKAGAAGVEIGDQLLAWNGLPYNSSLFVASVLDATPGEVVTLELKRGESTLTVEVPLIANE
jgi:hypothetical protein